MIIGCMLMKLCGWCFLLTREWNRLHSQSFKFVDHSTCCGFLEQRLMHTSTSSRLDCYNGLLYSLPNNIINQLQLIQNSAAQVLTRTQRRENILHVLKNIKLGALQFKIILFVFEALHGLVFLSDMYLVYEPVGPLRISGKNLFGPSAGQKMRQLLVFMLQYVGIVCLQIWEILKLLKFLNANLKLTSLAWLLIKTLMSIIYFLHSLTLFPTFCNNHNIIFTSSSVQSLLGYYQSI